MYRSATLLLIILAASLPATSVAAQVDTHPTDTRSGAWFGFGAGLGSQSVSCSICTQDRRVGTAVYLRGGATLNPRVRLGLETGDWVDVASRRGTITARLLVTGRSPQGTVFIPFHFAEAAANVLTDQRLDERAKIPDYKVCGVRIVPAATIPSRAGAELALSDRGAIKDPLVT